MITIATTKDHELIATLNEEVQNLHHNLYPEIFKPFNKTEVTNALYHYINAANCQTYIALKEGVAIGYIILYIKKVEENAFHHDSTSLYVDQIGVLKAHQHLGIGQLLLKQAEQVAKELSINRLELDHWSTNTIAAAYFRKNGYTACKERLFKIISLMA